MKYRILCFLLVLVLLTSCSVSPTVIPDSFVPPVRVVDGSAVETLPDPNQDALCRTAAKMQTIRSTYLDGLNVFYAIVPDKNYYTDSDWNYTLLQTTLRDELTSMTEIPLWDALAFESYYRTDLHWRQECLDKVAETLCSAMNAPYTVMPVVSYVLSKSYRGVYADSAAEDDTLSYLTDTATDATQVTRLDEKTLAMTPGVLYDLDQQNSHDLYNVFLSGAMPLMTLENPNSTGEKRLVVFRDSFTSSLAPLLTDAYRTVTLVDLRYIVSPLLADYIDFSTYDDALFLYSVPILCNSTAWKVFSSSK